MVETLIGIILVVIMVICLYFFSAILDELEAKILEVGELKQKTTF